MTTFKRMCLFFTCFLFLLCAGCSPKTTDWFGMQVSPNDWEVITSGSDEVRLGTIEHRSLDGCVATIMTGDPLFVAGYPAGWEGTSEHFSTSKLNVVQVTVRDAEDALQMIYYEIYDGTGQRSPQRLAYYRLDVGADVEQCTQAFRKLLETVDPLNFPDLPVAQG